MDAILVSVYSAEIFPDLSSHCNKKIVIRMCSFKA